jgi:hypothetical protein
MAAAFSRAGRKAGVRRFAGLRGFVDVRGHGFEGQAEAAQQFLAIDGTGAQDQAGQAESVRCDVMVEGASRGQDNKTRTAEIRQQSRGCFLRRSHFFARFSQATR